MQRYYAVSLMLAIVQLAIVTHADPLSPSMRREDTRLARRVSLSSRRITIGELLTKLSMQSGVSLSASEPDGAADISVAVFLQDVPLGDAMDALWSLVSYKRAEWHWGRSGSAGAFAYRLLCPLAAQQLAARLQNWVQVKFEADAAIFIAAARMTKEERARFKDKLVDAADGNLSAVEYALTDENYWIGLKLFGELPPDQQLRVLRGLERPEVPIDKLTDEGRAFLRSPYHGPRDYIWHRGGTTELMPEPSLIQFKRVQSYTTSTPTLFIHVVSIAPGVKASQGHGYLGGNPLESAFRRMMRDLWTLPEDAPDDPAAQKTSIAPRDAAATAEEDWKHILERRMEEIADSVPIALIARLPGEQEQWMDRGAPYGNTVEQYMKRLEGLPYMHKWRDHILLVSSMRWYIDDGTDAPVKLVEQLRKAETKGRGLLSFKDLVWVADTLNDETIKSLQTDYPFLVNVAVFRPLFHLCGQSPQAERQMRLEGGIMLTDEVVNALRSIQYTGVARHLDDGTAKSLRLVERETSEKDLPTKTIMFQLLSEEGKPLTGFGFRYGSSRSVKATAPSSTVH